MPRWELYALFVVLVALPVAVGTRRGYARARCRAGQVDRNPGPEGSYAWIRFSLRCMPGWFNRAGMDLGTWVAWLTLPRQRACSREYLRLALGREPGALDVWRHIRAYTDYLILRLGVCNGEEPRVRFAAGDGEELRAWLADDRPALYGTMHMGHSDMLGFYLSQIGGAGVHDPQKSGQLGRRGPTRGALRRERVVHLDQRLEPPRAGHERRVAGREITGAAVRPARVQF